MLAAGLAELLEDIDRPLPMKVLALDSSGAPLGGPITTMRELLQNNSLFYDRERSMVEAIRSELDDLAARLTGQREFRCRQDPEVFSHLAEAQLHIAALVKALKTVVYEYQEP